MIITKGCRLEDRDRLHKINVSCYSGIQCPPYETFMDMLTREVWVAREGELIIGFAICNHSYLWSLAVDPIYQGRGVGGNLLREVIKYYTLAESSEISLHVHPDNPAQKIYFDYGFRVEAIARNWYKAEGHGLYMRRALP